MLQQYLGEKLTSQEGAIGWILDDDMRIDERAREYIRWLPVFRSKGVDVLLGAYEGSSPNPPLNGLRVQLMDFMHNLTWLIALPEESILPDRTAENSALRHTFPDYYYDLSRKHTAHLEAPLWLEPCYEYETVKEARARLVSGALGILNGTPLTRSLVVPMCKEPLAEARDSVNRGGCTFILNPDAVLYTPNLIPMLGDKEARRSDMVWAIINRYYRRMTIKAVSFPVYHVGRTSKNPTINNEKVQGEIVGSALYAGLTDFLKKHPENNLKFSECEIQWIYARTIEQMTSRIRLLQQSMYRINGLKEAIQKVPFADHLMPLIQCLEREFSLTAFEKIQTAIQNINKDQISTFLNQLAHSADSYKFADYTVTSRKIIVGELSSTVGSQFFKDQVSESIS